MRPDSTHELAGLFPSSPREQNDAFDAVADVLPPVVPSHGARERRHDQAKPPGRLARVGRLVAELLDVSAEDAARVANCVRGFVRVASGARFPEHLHVGLERVLVLQGAYRDSVTGERFGPGAVVAGAAGDAHAFDAIADGPDLLQLSVIETAVLVDGVRLAPRP